MAKAEAVGHCKCPDCDFPDAEIKRDKNGFAYRFCPDCNLQTFTRTKEKSERMLSKMRPVTVTVIEPKKEPLPPVTVTPTVTNTPTKKSGFDMGL